VGRGKRTDFLTVKRDQPIEINSEELELLTEGDAKRLIFNHEVLVAQGEMLLSAGYLEAFYPDGASQPAKLIASRNVRLTDGNLEVRCFEVIYLRDDGLVICRGDALLIQGCDEVRGEEIVFYLDEERVEINGAASVVLRLDQDDPTDCEPGGTG
jgi:lipopolysaccharide export system protein LptA